MQQYMAKARERGRQRTAHCKEVEAQLLALQEAARKVVKSRISSRPSIGAAVVGLSELEALAALLPEKLAEGTP